MTEYGAPHIDQMIKEGIIDSKTDQVRSSKPGESSRTKTFEEPGLTRTYEFRKDGHVYTRNTEMPEGKWQLLTKGLSDSARQRLIERIFDKGENYLGEEPPAIVESAKPEVVAPEKKPRESSQPLIEPRKKVEEVAKDLGIEGVDWSQQEVEVTPAEVQAVEAINPTIAKGEYKGLSRKEAIAKAAEKRRQALAKAERIS